MLFRFKYTFLEFPQFSVNSSTFILKSSFLFTIIPITEPFSQGIWLCVITAAGIFLKPVFPIFTAPVFQVLITTALYFGILYLDSFIRSVLFFV